MNSDRIKEIQETTAYPESVSVKQVKAFLTWLEKEGGSPFIDKDALIDDWLKSL